MSTVTAVVTTVGQDFPAGTVDTTYVFTLLDSTNTGVGSVEVAVPTAEFDLVPDGTYTVRVVKNGVTVSSEPFTVVSTVTLQVPGTVSVTVS